LLVMTTESKDIDMKAAKPALALETPGPAMFTKTQKRNQSRRRAVTRARNGEPVGDDRKLAEADVKELTDEMDRMELKSLTVPSGQMRETEIGGKFRPTDRNVQLTPEQQAAALQQMQKSIPSTALLSTDNALRLLKASGATTTKTFKPDLKAEFGNAPGFKAYKAGRAHERRIMYPSADSAVRSSHTGVPLIAVTTRFAVGIKGNLVHVLEFGQCVTDDSFSFDFKPTKIHVSPRHTIAAVHGDKLVLGTEYGGVTLYQLHACDIKTSVVLHKPVADNQNAPMASCVAVNDKYALALFMGSKLMAFDLEKRAGRVLAEQCRSVCGVICLLSDVNAFVGCVDGSVAVFSLLTGKSSTAEWAEAKDAPAEGREIMAMAHSGDGKFVAAATASSEIRVWHMTPKGIRRFKLDMPVQGEDHKKDGCIMSLYMQPKSSILAVLHRTNIPTLFDLNCPHPDDVVLFSQAGDICDQPHMQAIAMDVFGERPRLVWMGSAGLLAVADLHVSSVSAAKAAAVSAGGKEEEKKTEVKSMDTSSS